MNELYIVNESRRTFLKAGAGLTLAVYAPQLFAAAAGPDKAGETMGNKSTLAPNAFVRIGTDDTVTVIAKHVEMGQGTYTGLPTILAEELDAAWSQVRVEGAPADASRFNNLNWGPVQGTGGSTAIANSFDQLREAGATARAMLITAAAQKWKVTRDEITVSEGVLMHQASGRKASFGQLAEQAAVLPIPEEIKLKDPKDFVLMGTRVPRTDTPPKTTGQAMFTQDIKLPGMLTAVVAHPPRFGGKIKSFDAGRARAIRGVKDVVAIPTGIAVLATDFWSAKQGRDALSVEWYEVDVFKSGSEEIVAQYQALARRPGIVVRKEGEAEAALSSAAKILEVKYEFPFLAHAAMEPMNCVMQLKPDGCEIWNGEQLHTVDQGAVAAVVGLKAEQVKINMLYAGGSFGRRANPFSDYLVETAYIIRAIKGRAPVKLVRTREDDTKAGYYRPIYVHTLRAGLDERGELIAWQHRIVGQSILAGTAFEKALVKDGFDATSVEGAINLPYRIPNFLLDLHTPKIGVPVQWWRSVGSTHTGFSTETFIDELATAANKDPVAFRLAMLLQHPRHAGVLNLVAEKAGWGQPLEKGKPGERRGRGVAVHESFNTYVAQVAEVSVKPDGTVKVDRVVCAVDCGIAINPDVICAQMEGGIGFGLGAALHSKITLKDGVVEQSNFNDYVVLRINEMPRIEVHIVPSNAKPTGVGEPGVPPIAPAVANAIFAATGKRIRSLPIDEHDLSNL